MNRSTVYKLQLIAFLNSMSFGLTYPFLSSYMQSLGADHVKIGIMSAGRLICSLLSTNFVISTIENGRQFGLDTFFRLAMLGHVPLIVAGNYWLVILGRFICSAVEKHSQTLCKSMLVEHAEIDKKEQVILIFNILSAVGYITGPIIAGFLYGFGHFYIGFMAFLITFINMCLSRTISSNTDVARQNSAVENSQELKFVIRDFRKSNAERNWDILTIKFLHVASVLIFCGKFSQVMRYNFEISNFAIGCTYAYMTILDFASIYFLDIVKDQNLPIPTLLLFEYCFEALAMLLVAAFFFPAYSVFMIMCIPIIFINNFMDTIWQDFFALRKQRYLEKLNNPTKIAAGLIVPIMFGKLCNLIKHHAVIIFAVLPVIVSIFILNKYTRHCDDSKVDEKND